MRETRSDSRARVLPTRQHIALLSTADVMGARTCRTTLMLIELMLVA